MSVTLDLSPELERRLLAEVERHGSADAAVEAMLDERLGGRKPPAGAKVTRLDELPAVELSESERVAVEAKIAAFRERFAERSLNLEPDFEFRRADCYRD